MRLHGPSAVIGAAATILLSVIAAMLIWPTPITPPAIPAPASPAVMATPASQPPPRADLILDLFEPSTEALTAQQKENALSAQIEHALVVTFLLTRCKLITQQDYADTYNALITFAYRRQMAPDLPGAEQHIREIAKSAGASYALVYSRVPCTDPSLPPLVGILQQWRTQSARTISDNSSTP